MGAQGGKSWRVKGKRRDWKAEKMRGDETRRREEEVQMIRMETRREREIN